MKNSVFLVEDHTLVRQGFRSLVESETWLEVVGEADDGREALAKIEDLTPDIVLMDMAMEGLTGLEATRRIKKMVPETKVIGVSVRTDTNLILRMFEAGADGYVPKESAFDELHQAMESVLDGHTYLSPRIAGPVLTHRLEHGPEDVPENELTPREREVLQLVAEGKTSKEIGKILHVSTKTVDNHRQSIMCKLDLHSVPELTKYAVREGIYPL